MNDKTIQTIAEAILANTRVLQSLVDALPREVKCTFKGVNIITSVFVL